jgi:hypothetical protein
MECANWCPAVCVTLLMCLQVSIEISELLLAALKPKRRTHTPHQSQKLLHFRAKRNTQQRRTACATVHFASKDQQERLNKYSKQHCLQHAGRTPHQFQAPINFVQI